MKSPLIESIESHFAEVKDPRQFGKVKHPLMNIIFLTICGVLCGADDWPAIQSFGQSQAEWLNKYLKWENGIPSSDTLERTFALIDSEQFQAGFLNWIKSVREVLNGVIALDGKQLRRSYEQGEGKGAIHMVSAWSVANGLVLGQRKVAEKSNEITAIPLLLAGLDLKSCIVTIDAMGCQRAIAAQIIDQKGDYVLALKGNQGQLYEDTTEMFAYFMKIGFKNIAHDKFRTVNKGHGRLEIRECWAFAPEEWKAHFRTLASWEGLQSLVMIRSQRQEAGKTTTEIRFFISSLEPNAKKLLEAVRAHWNIENQLHWVLDVAFNEDQSRVRKGYAAENLAVIRHLVLNLLTNEKTVKLGKRTKRLRCGWDVAYRERVLARFNSLG